MKFFKKYYLVLPPAALIYGIYVLNMKYPKDGFPQMMMDSLVNGWYGIWILFAVLAAGIIYQLQNNKKQEYIYSLPWTKQEIYKKSMTGLQISLIIAEIIYGICFTAKVATIPDIDPMNYIILCTLVNAFFCFVLCGIVQVMLTVTSYIWQGLILTILFVFWIIPMIAQNIAFLMQVVFKFGKTANIIVEWSVYSQERSMFYPLRYASEVLVSFFGGTEKIWMKQYPYVAVVCIAALLIAGLICFWYAKRKYITQDLSQNRMLTRLSIIENRIIMTIITGIFCFNSVSNQVVQKVDMESPEGTWISGVWNIVFNQKALELDETNIQKINGGHMLLYFVMIFVICYLAVTLIQTIRRKQYERDY